MITTTFTELAGCSAPIQQAPMGPVVTPQLSAAVARAGGVGSISVMPGLPKVRVRGARRRAGSTEITDAFAVCPLCATLPRARVLRSAIEAVNALGGSDTGTMPTPEGEMTLPARFGMPPHRDVQGRIEAMAHYAGQDVGSVTEVVPAADIVHELTSGAETLLRRWA